MVGSILVDLLVLTACTLGIRLIATVRPSSDNWGVMTKIANQRRSRWITYELGDSLLPGNFPYPMLSHFLLSRLPKKRWALGAVVMNLGSDVVLAWGMYAAVRLGIVGTSSPGTDAAVIERGIAFFGAAAFATSPVLVPLTSRVRATNGRAPSLPLATVWFAAVGWAAFGGGPAAWALAALALLALALTSFFGLQVAVFTAPLLALWLSSWSPLVILGVVGAAAWRWRGLGVRDLLVFKVNHWIWYGRNRHQVANVANRNLLWNALRLPALFARDAGAARKLLFQQSPLWILAWSVPQLWVLGAALLDPGFRAMAAAEPLLWASLGCVAAAGVLFVLTSIDPLTIFGQAERYFEYATPALALLVAAWAAAQGAAGVLALGLLTLGQISIILSSHVLSQNANLRRLTRGQDDDKPEKELALRLQELPGELRVATVPVKLPALLSFYTKPKLGERLRWYYRFIQHPERALDGFGYFAEDTDTLDLFGGVPEDLMKRYGIEWVVADNAFLAKRRDGSSFVQALVRFPVVYENRRYSLYDLRGGPA